MEITRILNQNYAAATQWSNRSKTCGYFNRLKKKIERFLIRLSGNDLNAMLEDVLNIGNFDCKYKESLKRMSNFLCNNSIIKPKKKHHIIRPFREAGLNLSQVHDLGFKCSHRLWNDCLDTSERNLGGKPPLAEDLVEAINKQIEDLSDPSSDKTVVIKTFSERNPCELYKKKTIGFTYKPVRYRKTTLLYAFSRFRHNSKKANHLERLRRLKIPFSTFRKKISKHFKKPFRKIDLCDYCEMGKKIESEIKSFIKLYNLEFNEEFNSSNLILFFTVYKNIRPQIDPRSEFSKLLNSNLRKSKELESIEYHKLVASKQRKAYNAQRTDAEFLNGKILIDLDYKQKIILGKGPRVPNADFFQANKKKLSFLGFGVYYVNEHSKIENGQLIRTQFKSVKCLNIDVISDYDGTKAYDMIRTFKHVMNLPQFSNISKDIDSYVIWSDCGTQFRSSEFIYFLFDELANQNIAVNLNFFAEKHGNKN
jgi:hypothetical protein